MVSIAAGIALVTIGAVNNIGTKLNTTFTTIRTQLRYAGPAIHFGCAHQNPLWVSATVFYRMLTPTSFLTPLNG